MKLFPLIRIIAILCAASVSSFAAELAFPAYGQPATGTWQAAGIPGGIPVRETIYTTITTTGDSTDRTATINAEIAACPNGQVIFFGPGTFRADGTIVFGTGKQVTLRGSVDANGVPTTIIDTRASTAISTTNFSFGSYGATTADTASLTKGATTITVADSSAFSNGVMVEIRMPDTADPVTHSVNTNTNLRAQIAKVADSGGVPNGTTLVLDAPGLHGDYSGAATATVKFAPVKTSLCGVENITIDCSNAAVFAGITFTSTYRCWVYNVRVIDYSNYGIYVTHSLQNEIRRMWIEYQNGFGTSTVGTLTDFSSQTLFIDNVYKNCIFGFFTQSTVSGSVFAYNTMVSSRPDLSPPWYFVTANSNHAPYNQFLLFEGNVMSIQQNDGYFGGSGFNTTFRNWLYGLEIAQTGYLSGVAHNRLSRFENIAGNVLGHGTAAGTGMSFGNPNIGNGDSSGTVSMYGARSTLTTRTSATAGTITAPSGHGVTTGATIDVYWMQVEGGYNIAKIRRGVTVGTVSGTSIPFSGGEGHDLPAASAEIFVPTSNAAIRAYSLDWDSALQRPRTWTGTLTTRTTASSGVITLGGGQAATFNAAIANAANSQRHFAWSGDSGTTGYVSGVVGDEVTVFGLGNGGGVFPAQGTAITIYPSNAGFQELDLDSLYTAFIKGNYYHQPSGSGIPAVESLGGDTLPNSMFLSSAPSFFTEAGMTWPPISTSTPPSASYEIIPSGKAYIDGYWPSDPNLVATPQFSPVAGTHAAGTTLTITCATSGATIHYTTNGDTPTTGSAVYSTPLSLSVGTTVVKAFAVKAAMTDSGVQSGTYVLVNAPTAPSSLGATAISTTQINLAWTDNSSTETGFRIERKVGAGAWGTVTTTAANATTYSNTGLTAATTYDYRVYAINVAGDSTASNTASATTNSEGGGGGGAANTTIQTLNVGTLNIQ